MCLILNQIISQARQAAKRKITMIFPIDLNTNMNINRDPIRIIFLHVTCEQWNNTEVHLAKFPIYCDLFFSFLLLFFDWRPQIGIAPLEPASTFDE